MRRAVVVFFLSAVLSGPTWAQTNNAEITQQELIQALLTRIERLEKRVQDLEAAKREPPVQLATGGPEPPAALPPAREYAAHLAEQVAGTPQQDIQVYPNLKMQGFADVNFSATDQRGTRSGFNLGQFVLHFASPLSAKVSFFGEISLTARPDSFAVELERAIIRYEHNDYLKVSFGRYHTPINWWNATFHHGQWLQTSISRPEMTQFGGRFIPVHFVGALVEGSIPSGRLGLNYNVGLGNGRGSILSRGGDAGDINNHRAWLINLFARPARFYGLQVGASVYGDRITLPANREFREWVTSFHAVWTKETPEVVAEFANVHHNEIGRDHPFNSQAFYVQVGYRLPWFEKLWKPYYRFEYIHIPRSDAVFAGVPNLAGSVLGIRYDITDYAAFKAEYRNFRRAPGVPRVNGAFVQTSFTF